MPKWFTQLRRCQRAGVKVEFQQILGMWLRKVRAGEVLEAVAIAAEAGVDFPLMRAETAFLAGVHPIDQALAAVIILESGRPVDLDAISVCDIAGFDVVLLARDGWDLSTVVGAKDGPGDEYRRPKRSE